MSPVGRSLQTVCFIIGSLLIGGSGWIAYTTIDRASVQAEQPAPEMAAMGSSEGRVFDSDMSFPELATYFQDLAREEGGEHAFAVMINSELPSNIDTHLLGHVIGDMLYEQEGLAGMSLCTHDFRNACSHSIVIGALLEHGVSVFDDINDICRQAPGDSGLSYNMCFHGFGHGVLAYTDYDLEAAVALCERTGTAEHHYYEFNECFGGVIMEIHAGIHDRETWQRNAVQYLDAEDPANLCEHSFIPDRVRDICYVYLTPFIFDLFTAGEFPTDEHIAQSFSYCDGIADTRNRHACYGGIGKELPGLLQGRDVSRIGQLTPVQLRQIEQRCALATTEAGYDVCNEYVLTSLYWGGENPHTFPAQYCGLVTSGDRQLSCYRNLHDVYAYYLPDDHASHRQRYCDSYQDEVRADCYEYFSL